MTVHSLAPGFIIVYYTSNGHPHKHIIPVRDPQPAGGGLWEVRRLDASFESVVTAMNTWATAIKPLFAAASNLAYWELWTKADEDADPIFRQTGALNVAGTSVLPLRPLDQIVFSYRTSEGGTGKLQFMEFAHNAGAKTTPVYSGVLLSVSNYLVGSTSIYVGRDGGYPIQVPAIFTKPNDFLRKKYVLNV